MSEAKLSKYLRTNNFEPPKGRSRRKPVIISDSKGFTLRNNIGNPFDKNIILWCKECVIIEQSLPGLKEILLLNYMKLKT